MSKCKDPALYRKLSEPHASREAAENAMDEFNREVRELREKYRIPEVSLVISVNCIIDGAEEASLMDFLHHGDQHRGLLMLASAFGQSRAELLAAIDKAIS